MKKFSIFNFSPRCEAGQFSISKGFTLIELLASMIVLIAVGTVLAVTLFSSLRGATKASTIASVKQNGFFAITQMTKMLRNAQRLDIPSSCLLPPVPTPAPTYQSITLTSLDGLQTTFSCGNSTIASNGASLLDTSTVSVVSCAFTCNQSTSEELPTVGIIFSLTQAQVTLLPEHTASIPFETSVILRNANR